MNTTKWSLEIHHIDIGGGQPAAGDATLIIVKDKDEVKRTCLIDGGSIANRKGFPVLRYLEEHIPSDKGLDLMINTHYDDDHLTGLIGLLQAAGQEKESTREASTPKSGHRLFQKTRIIDAGFKTRYVKDVNNKHEKYLKSIYGIRQGALSKTDNAIVDEKEQILVRYVDSEKVIILDAKGEEQEVKLESGVPDKIFALKEIERTHVTRLVTDFKSYQVQSKPSGTKPQPKEWLLKQGEILWSKGDSSKGKLVPKTPKGAPVLTCITVNSHYLNENGEPKEYEEQFSDIETHLDNASLAFVLTFNKFKYYIGGDLRTKIENKVSHYLNKCDNFSKRVHVIKASHHGADTSTSEQFLERLRPIVAIISCGLKNPHSQPHKKTIDRLQKTEYTDSVHKPTKLFTQAYYLTGFFNPEKVEGVHEDKQFIPNLGEKQQTEFNKYSGVKVSGEMYHYDSDEKEWSPETVDNSRALSKVSGLPGNVIVTVSEAESERESLVGQKPTYSLFQVTCQGLKSNQTVPGKDDKTNSFEREAHYRPITDVFKQAVVKPSPE